MICDQVLIFDFFDFQDFSAPTPKSLRCTPRLLPLTFLPCQPIPRVCGVPKTPRECVCVSSACVCGLEAVQASGRAVGHFGVVFLGVGLSGGSV